LAPGFDSVEHADIPKIMIVEMNPNEAWRGVIKGYINYRPQTLRFFDISDIAVGAHIRLSTATLCATLRLKYTCLDVE
jgi:hypothetical protein